MSLGVNGLGKQGSGAVEPWRAVGRRGTAWGRVPPTCPGLWERVSARPHPGSDPPVPGERLPGRILSEHLVGKVRVFPNAEKNQLRKWEHGTSIITSLL